MSQSWLPDGQTGDKGSVMSTGIRLCSEYRGSSRSSDTSSGAYMSKLGCSCGHTDRVQRDSSVFAQGVQRHDEMVATPWTRLQLWLFYVISGPYKGPNIV